MGGELAWFVLLYSLSAYIRLHVDMEKEHSAKWLAIAGGILFVILSGVTINYLMRELYPENIQSRIRELFLRKEGIMTLLLSVKYVYDLCQLEAGLQAVSKYPGCRHSRCLSATRLWIAALSHMEQIMPHGGNVEFHLVSRA